MTRPLFSTFWTPERTARRNPSRPAASKPKALPKGFEIMTLDLDADLYRGTQNIDDWREGWQWFTDNAYTAQMYMEGRDGAWCVLWLTVKRTLHLVHLKDYRHMDRLGRSLGVSHSGDPHEIAPAICALGIDGWHMDEGNHDGTDVVICNPVPHLSVIRIVAESEGWAREEAKAARRRR